MLVVVYLKEILGFEYYYAYYDELKCLCFWVDVVALIHDAVPEEKTEMGIELQTYGDVGYFDESNAEMKAVTVAEEMVYSFVAELEMMKASDDMRNLDRNTVIAADWQEDGVDEKTVILVVRVELKLPVMYWGMMVANNSIVDVSEASFVMGADLESSEILHSEINVAYVRPLGFVERMKINFVHD